MTPTPSSADRKKAAALHEEAMSAYNRWDVDTAVEKLEAALKFDPANTQYHLNLAQALSRSGDFDRALRALANYLRLAPDSPVAERIEQLFGSGMDPVENMMTEKMTSKNMPLEIIGAAIQMWMEFRIALGEEPLHIPKPETWAAALDYTVMKVNLREENLDDLATFYDVSNATVRKHHLTLVDDLDIMPCDYRYFTGKDNPLDKLVEAAELLERLEERFKEK
ncbi:MAG: tetratricopeptide repeat protein [Chloroflexi bacterium]|jgi:tetratricopeptide (TPR) repeat protein|nr:tetratricopeptide repeat protein [Chloroflexota bacterium]